MSTRGTVAAAGASPRTSSGHGAGAYLFRDTLLMLLHAIALPYALLIERDEPGDRRRENDALIRREARRQARRPC